MKYPRKSVLTAAVLSTVAAILAAASTTRTLEAKEWGAWVGAQSRDLGSQALAFLPNELWVHTNDSVRWNLESTEIHTVTFLKPGQTRPPNFGPAFGLPIGCPGNTPDGASFDESTCVNSGIVGTGGNIGIGLQTYSVTFSVSGNFKFVCLVHIDMTGTVHVLNPSQALPYEQTFYDTQAWNDAANLVSEASGLTSRANFENDSEAHIARVTAGIGEI